MAGISALWCCRGGGCEGVSYGLPQRSGARRRLGDLEAQGLTVSYEQVLEEIRQRDHQDMTRSIAPLKQAKDAVVLDTSSLNQEESLAALKAIVEERIAR